MTEKRGYARAALKAYLDSFEDLPMNPNTSFTSPSPCFFSTRTFFGNILRPSFLASLFLFPASFGLLSACASSQNSDQQQGSQFLGKEVVGKESIERYDLNGDGEPDFFKVYATIGPEKEPSKQKTVLARYEIDLNFDGKIDVYRYFNELGDAVREEVDLDFDGKIDAIDYYDEGVLFRREMAFNFDQKPSVVKYYKNKELIRKERDTTGNGVLDTFEFYEKGKLVRIGLDKNNDGKPDVYIDAKPEESSN